MLLQNVCHFLKQMNIVPLDNRIPIFDSLILFWSHFEVHVGLRFCDADYGFHVGEFCLVDGLVSVSPLF